MSGKSRIVASIEARMGSSRLPGKVLMDIEGKPAIQRLAERLARAETLDGVVLATSTAPGDDVLAAWAEDFGLPVFRGSENDVLSRVVGAQRFMDSDVVVEVTGDCTLLDPQIVDMGVETFTHCRARVVANVHPLSYPMGMDIQVFGLDDLAWVADNVDDPAVREHVSLYFYEHPDEYDIVNLFAPARWRRPELRTMLDYPEDLEFIRAVYRALEPEYGPCFGLEELLALLRERPELAEINIHCHRTTPR